MANKTFSVLIEDTQPFFVQAERIEPTQHFVYLYTGDEIVAVFPTASLRSIVEGTAIPDARGKQ